MSRTGYTLKSSKTIYISTKNVIFTASYYFSKSSKLDPRYLLLEEIHHYLEMTTSRVKHAFSMISMTIHGAEVPLYNKVDGVMDSFVWEIHFMLLQAVVNKIQWRPCP
jgi:hypothetical protein